MSSAVPGPKINYAGNSNLDKQIAAEEASKAEPRVKKIEGVKVLQSKPTLGAKFRKNFGGANLKAVGMAVLIEVIVPNAKDLLFDVISEGSQRTIYGESGRRRGGSIGSSIASTIVGSRTRGTNYSNISTQSRIVGSASTNTSLSARERQMFDVTHLAFPDKFQATEVIERMSDAISEFGMVTAADFYDLIGEDGNGFTDQKFGWDTRAFAGTKVIKVRDGWAIDLMPPLEVK